LENANINIYKELKEREFFMHGHFFWRCMRKNENGYIALLTVTKKHSHVIKQFDHMIRQIFELRNVSLRRYWQFWFFVKEQVSVKIENQEMLSN
jgi:hypothetical protein